VLAYLHYYTSAYNRVETNQPPQDLLISYMWHRVIDRFRRNLECWCSSTFLTVPTVKNLKISKIQDGGSSFLTTSVSQLSLTDTLTVLVYNDECSPLCKTQWAWCSTSHWVHVWQLRLVKLRSRRPIELHIPI